MSENRRMWGTQRAKRAARDERGFTLIELLVVIIIIGILAAVAIPVFLNQRHRAYDAAVKSDLRQVAEFQEAELIERSSYQPLAQLVADGFDIRLSKGVTVSLVTYDTVKAYCLSGRHSGSTVMWFYDSQAGGLQPRGTAGCPVTASGTAGDSLP